MPAVVRARRSSLVLEIVALAAPFFGLIVAGFIAARRWPHDPAGLDWLNTFVIWFALPALFFRLMSDTPIELLLRGRFVLATTGATAAALLLSFAIARWLARSPPREAVIQALVGGYGNVGYMGPPLALLALGPAAAGPVALVFCADIALVFAFVPILFALIDRGESSVLGLAALIARRVLLHPFVVASLLGLAASALGLRLPRAADTLVAMLSAAAAPCALFALGVTVASRPIERVARLLPVLIAVKLAVHPAIALLFLTLLGPFETAWTETGVLMAALPPAATIFVFATQYGVYVLRASSAVLIGTAVSLPTLTLVLYVVTHDLPPHGPP